MLRGVFLRGLVIGWGFVVGVVGGVCGFVGVCGSRGVAL
jgi:hypothetical protein